MIADEGLAVPAPAVGVVTEGGMTGRQITLIVLDAALVAATAAVMLGWARAADRAASAAIRHPCPAVSRAAAPGPWAGPRRDASLENVMITTPNTAENARRCRDDPVVTDLVARASTGDRQAWNALVERYAPLIWSICRRHGLGDAEAEDVGQNVWLKLVSRLGSVREPAALPGWLATTTRRECARILRVAPSPRDAGYLLDVGNVPDDHSETADQFLMEAERHAALCQALAELPACDQELITLLASDPPPTYAEISVRLGIAVGSIGPSRGRCLNKLRRHPAIIALINADADTT